VVEGRLVIHSRLAVRPVTLEDVSHELRAIAQETLQIVKQGGYRAVSGREVRLAEGVAHAVAGTRLYLPAEEVAVSAPAGAAPAVRVTNETTLSAARRLGDGVAGLVFASAKSPGGGFLNGAQAQEESIARASALYACQTAVPQFYTFHRQQRDLRYSDQVIYSPAVPVFRGDDGMLLPRPYPVSFLTAAAPNLGTVIAAQPELAGAVPAMLGARAARVLQVAAGHGHRLLVLGAWGCGVFRNDPVLVAGIFADLLARSGGWFDQVVFAVHDRQPGTPTYAAFASALT
jgi:uncharacterized protein (TIGR02452 family)